MARPVAWHLAKLHLLFALMSIPVAVADCTNKTCTAAGMFIQRRAISGKNSPEAGGVDGPTWVASPFSGCKRVCQSDSSSAEKEFPAGFAFQDRSVQCFSRSGHLIGESHCVHLMKPRAYRRCWCGVSWCPAACEALTLTAFVDDNDASGATGESDQDSDYECLGCYALGREKHEEQTHINASKKKGSKEGRKEGRKDGWMDGWMETRKDESKEARKQGSREGRKQGWKEEGRKDGRKVL